MKAYFDHAGTVRIEPQTETDLDILRKRFGLREPGDRIVLELREHPRNVWGVALCGPAVDIEPQDDDRVYAQTKEDSDG
jgi:hypothetical protein